MSGSGSGVLANWYENRIGKATTRDEVQGYWIFVLGMVVGVVGLALFLVSQSSAQMTRGAGIALAALGLMMLVTGPIIRLHLRRTATYLVYLGFLIGLAAVVWFVIAYPDNWVRGQGFSKPIIALYAVGFAVTALGGIVVPMTTSPRKVAEEMGAALDAERSGREAAESEAASERAERTAAEDEAGTAAAEREAAAAEIERIQASQSQFELYEDRGGEARWRLRHRNGNVIATSGEGYSSKQKARQGLNGVRRDALGAALVEIEPEEIEEDEPEDAEPEYVPDHESQATFELYEDNEGKYRWRLLHDNGHILTDSGEGYASWSGLEEAVERVRHYAQTAEYLRVDPVAFEIYRDAAGEHRWRLLHENGNILADSGEGYSSRTKARQGLQSVRDNAPEGGDAEFEVYEDNAGQYRWRLRHDNGNIIADGGEGYSSESEAEDAVERVRDYAPEAPHLDIETAAFEIYEDAAEEWRWRLRHRNGNIMADSGEGYASRSNVTEAINSVKRNAPNAETERVE